ncbi:MAG: dimethylsulfonioproprionate lyase family protein [Dehalococcoidia bacterium]|nr:dimethylsulfonioproprionate lyase family protein [Dehalococcoidia bacterium]MDW8119561.1 dimethylsulfonioproprionate lyase family protein [Chloroflexota bacterium]
MMAKPKVVVRPEEFRGGAPMEARPGVRDLKLIYPELGVPTKTLIMGIVEIAPGAHSPLHKHNCEEVYYVLQGRGVLESGGERYDIAQGYAVYNPPDVPHRVFNTGDIPIRLVVVAGIMFVGLLPEWPTPSPYVILEK